MDKLLMDISRMLEENIDEKTLNTGQNFFKEKIRLHGVRVPEVNRISKEVFSLIKDWPKEKLFSLCEEFWKSGYLEESFMACNLSYYIHAQYTVSDFEVFDRWVNLYINNWASCDTLCNHSVGTFIEIYPDYIERLKIWTRSNNRWVRRAAAVTLIIPARKGLFKDDIFDIADILLLDNDDMVRKGYGWMLKAASEAYQKEVFDYVVSNKSVMPRTSLRYAIEKMPDDMRRAAMAK